MYRQSEDEVELSGQLPQVSEGSRNVPAVLSRVEGSGLPAAASRKSGRLRLAALAAAVATVLSATGWYGEHWWTIGRFMVSTDDAYVRAHNATLAAKVSGYVAAIPIEDNSELRAGQVIATIDDVDYRLAADAAREKVATQQATVDRFARQIDAQHANVEQAKAQLQSMVAAAKRMRLEFDRQQTLSERQFASRQTVEQAQANRDQADAALKSAQAALDGAQANVRVLAAQEQEAARTLDELTTALAKAESDLSYTVIRAPVDGVFGNRAVQTGDFVQPGQRLASLVPLDEVYVEANFKELSSRACGRDSRSLSASMPCPGVPSRARSRACRPPPAPCSRCCLPTMRPGISPRSCSACRSASTFLQTSPRKGCCGPACRSSSALIPGSKQRLAKWSLTMSRARPRQ